MPHGQAYARPRVSRAHKVCLGACTHHDKSRDSKLDGEQRPASLLRQPFGAAASCVASNHPRDEGDRSDGDDKRDEQAGHLISDTLDTRLVRHGISDDLCKCEHREVSEAP